MNKYVKTKGCEVYLNKCVDMPYDVNPKLIISKL